jgi:tyrosine-protein phosphatase SIW14
MPLRARLIVPALVLPTLIAGCGSPGKPSAPATAFASVSASPLPAATPSTCARKVAASSGPYAFVPPRGNVPAGAPLSQGMTVFSVVAPGILARGGTPDESGFSWLKQHGWKSVVDLRTTDDNTYAGFVADRFQYLWLAVGSGLAPTPDQARSFLCFLVNPANQPVFVHDNSGAERVDMFVALYRYAVQGWPIDVAVREEKLYGDSNSINLEQQTFLQAWANQYPPGTLP